MVEVAKKSGRAARVHRPLAKDVDDDLVQRLRNFFDNEAIIYEFAWLVLKYRHSFFDSHMSIGH